MTDSDGLRSLEQVLADLVEKYNQMPDGNERAELERMIRALEAEIAQRETRD
jgi:hypothetical protein